MCSCAQSARSADPDFIVTYLREAIATFDADPADSDYQRGYVAALKETLRVAEERRP